MKNIKGNKPLFLWNGVPAPIPAGDFKVLESQMVDSKRNANAEVVSRKINRRQKKFDGLFWSKLTYEEMRWVKQHIENFEVMLTYWSIEHDAPVTAKFYFGDLSYQNFGYDSKNYVVAKPLEFINVSVNIIDMGYEVKML